MNYAGFAPERYLHEKRALIERCITREIRVDFPGEGIGIYRVGKMRWVFICALN